MNMVPFAVKDHVPDELKFEQGYVNDALFDLRGEVGVHRRRHFSYSVDVFRVRGLRARSNVREIIERRFSYLEVFAVQGVSSHRAFVVTDFERSDMLLTPSPPFGLVPDQRRIPEGENSSLRS
jgi:hypothetical protein